jgi:hypothetical protein
VALPIRWQGDLIDQDLSVMAEAGEEAHLPASASSHLFANARR